MGMVHDPPDLTVHTVSYDHRWGQTFYASLSEDDNTLNGCRTNGADGKMHLLSILLNHAAKMESPFWKFRHSWDSAAHIIRVVRGPLGKPHLLLGDYRGPAVSFSYGGGKIWAALRGDGSDIGIDVAAADEFQGKYPVHRVFHDHERHHAMHLAGGDMEMASALLWSIKEAVVKALGCAFHLVMPHQVYVYPSMGGAGGHTFVVFLSKKVLAQPSGCDDQPIWVRSFPLTRMWLSIALLTRQSQ